MNMTKLVALLYTVVIEMMIKKYFLCFLTGFGYVTSKTTDGKPTQLITITNTVCQAVGAPEGQTSGRDFIVSSVCVCSGM